MVTDQKKSARFFTFLVFSILILCISVSLFVKLFFNTYMNQLIKIEDSGYGISETVNKEIAVRSHAVRAMKLMGEQFLKKRVSLSFNIHSCIIPVADKDGYTLLLPEGYSREDMGAVTAFGKIPDPGSDKLDEIAMSLYLTPMCRTLLDRFPGTPWVYYTSLKDFIYMYPFVSPDDFFFSRNLYNLEFMRGALSDKNPEGKVFWTDVYSDEAGKGLMVTVSAPVAEDGEIKGAISTDVSMEQLGRLIKTQEIPYSQVYLVSEKGTILYGTDDSEINILPDNYPKGKISPYKSNHITVYNLAVEKWSLVVASDKKGLLVNTLRIVSPYFLIIIFMLTGLILIVKLQKALKKVDELSNRDALTRVWNRRMFDLVSAVEYSAASRQKTTFGLIILDIDFFKQYNDTYGHQEGDSTLLKVASALTEALRRSTDYVFRVGGEEFAVITLIRNNKQLLMEAEIVRAAVEKLNIPHEKSPHKKITVSCGAVLVCFHEEACTFETFYKLADKALYKAKENGRNSVYLSDENNLLKDK